MVMTEKLEQAHIYRSKSPTAAKMVDSRDGGGRRGYCVTSFNLFFLCRRLLLISVSLLLFFIIFSSPALILTLFIFSLSFGVLVTGVCSGMGIKPLRASNKPISDSE